MTIEVGNAQHVGSREEQEDAFAFSDLSDGRTVAHAGVLGVLSDGMGGLSRGALMAQTAVRSFLEAYGRKSSEEPIPTALARSLCEANRTVFDLARSLGSGRAAGATLVAAAVHQNALYWVSAGDSRAYVVREGRAHRLTVDHNWAADVARGVRLDDARPTDAAVPGATLTSFLGLPNDPRMDGNVRAYPLAAGDTVLLASDGLHQALAEDEIGGAMAGRGLRQGCETLVKTVVQRSMPDQDNVTVMAMAVPAPASSGIAVAEPLKQPQWLAWRPVLAFVLTVVDLLLLAILGCLRWVK